MQAFAAVVISLVLTVALIWFPIAGTWWDVARWALYLPIVWVGARYGSFAGLCGGVAASLLCIIVVLMRGMGDASWLSIVAPDFAVVGLLGGFMQKWPRFRNLYSAGATDSWPTLSRVYEPEIALDPNPLASIESAARLLEESDTPDEMRRELVGIVVRECKHLSASITGLLQQRREVTQALARKTDIRPIIDAAVHEAEFILSGRDIELRTQIATDLPPIECDHDQIRNLCISLIINLAQSAASGTALDLVARSRSNGIVLDLSGQGHFAHRLANRFFGPRPGTSAASLAAAQDIVRWHGGRISGHKSHGRGLEFSVWLPLDRKDNNGDRQDTGGGGR